MKVKLTVSRTGVGFTQNRGDEIEVGDQEGARLLKAGKAVALAEPIAPSGGESSVVPETATAPAASEKAVKPAGKAK